MARSLQTYVTAEHSGPAPTGTPWAGAISRPEFREPGFNQPLD
jgi:hypothetical protein